MNWKNSPVFKAACHLVLLTFTYHTLQAATIGFDATGGYAEPASPTPKNFLLPAAQPLGSATIPTTDPPVTLPGHVLPALAGARPAMLPAGAAEESLALTITLKRTDQAGFDRYLREVYDPSSAQYRRFLSSPQLADRFGPSPDAYARVLRYLQGKGFTLVQGSANRLTLTVSGTRPAAEQAFGVRIRDFEQGGRRFRANDQAPRLPASIAQEVQAVTGLANAAVASPANILENTAVRTLAGGAAVLAGFYLLLQTLGALSNANPPPQNPQSPQPPAPAPAPPPPVVRDLRSQDGKRYVGALAMEDPVAIIGANPPASATGAGQKVGIVAFSAIRKTDIADWLALEGFPASLLDQVQQVDVNGGAPLGPYQSDVLLAVQLLLSIAPKALVTVYQSPLTGTGSSFQAVFNAMINDGVTIISNSFGYCEDQTTAADAQSIDAILATAAATGISVFNATGDSGNNCGGGTSILVPADSPNATAVGGTALTLGPGYTYGGETWWDGSAATPPTGQGGFGTSRYFARPAYQAGLIGGAARSVPDVAAPANGELGLQICQQDGGGCPTGPVNAGTSVAAPVWAAFTALLNEAHGHALGFLNPRLYPLAGTHAFHSAASMNSDPVHVGLGSPNVDLLNLALAGLAPGPADPTASRVLTDPPNPYIDSVLADGAAAAAITVRLRDINGHMIAGKAVTLTPNAGSHASIDPSGAATNADNGAAFFRVRNTQVEDVVITARVDGVELGQKATLHFVAPAPSAAGINATPPNGATATVTVTLQDAQGRGTPKKLVQLAQGVGHSVIVGPNPSVTDADGRIQFTVTNQVNETVTYTAVDISDGLNVPGSAAVTFNAGNGSACGAGTPPSGANGYLLTAFVTGFDAAPFFYGNVNFGGCPGGTLPVFGANATYVSSFKTGGLYRLGPGGGSVSTGNLLITTQPALELLYGKDGKLYGTYVAGSTGFTAGSIVELDPATGSVVRTLATGLTCPSSLSVDPLSGDLFFASRCFGAGADDPNIYRIRDSGSATPVIEPYATLPTTPTGVMVFSPSGSIYVVSGYTGASPPVLKVSGTNVAGPPAITDTGARSDYSLALGETLPNGEAKTLFVHGTNNNVGELKLADITAQPVAETVVATGPLVAGITGPDGCLYTTTGDSLYKLTGINGECGFTPTNLAPALELSPAVATPNPAQGDPRTFTVNFRNVNAPAGTPVRLTVLGPNLRVLLGRTDATGRASFRYAGTFTGTDAVLASAAVGGQSLQSNVAKVTWEAGRHETFLTLNPSPKGGTVGRPVAVQASLTDSSVDPPAAMANQPVEITLDAGQCAAMTDAAGIATCTLIPGSTAAATLKARFAGAPQWLPAEAVAGFTALAPVTPPPLPPSVSISSHASAPGRVILTWSSLNTTSCVASGAWSGPRATSGSEEVSQPQPGAYEYILTCQGPGGTASSSASAPLSCGPILFKVLKPGLKRGKKRSRLAGRFVLGANSDGIRPAAEAVTVTVGNYSATVPPGKFKANKAGKRFKFKGKIDRRRIKMLIRQTGRSYRAVMEGLPGKRVIATGKRTPVQLCIGNDGGSVVVTGRK